MSEPEKLKNSNEEHIKFDSTESNKKSEPSGITGFKDKIVGKITGTQTVNQMKVMSPFLNLSGYLIISE